MQQTPKCSITNSAQSGDTNDKTSGSSSAIVASDIYVVKLDNGRTIFARLPAGTRLPTRALTTQEGDDTNTTSETKPEEVPHQEAVSTDFVGGDS